MCGVFVHLCVGFMYIVVWVWIMGVVFHGKPRVAVSFEYNREPHLRKSDSNEVGMLCV